MTEHTNLGIFPPSSPVSDNDLTSPVAHAVADAYNPKYETGRDVETDYMRKAIVRNEGYAANALNAAASELDTAINRIEALAQIKDSRILVENIKNNLQQLFSQVTIEHQKYVDIEKDAERKAEEFRIFEKRDVPAEDSYSVRPDWGTLILSGAAVIVAEALVFTAYIGPYAPGGVLQAFGLAMIGGLSISALALAFGGFGLRGFYNSTAWVRRLARVTTVLAPVAAKALLAYTAAFRTHLESGLPISEWLHHVSPDIGFFVIISIAIFIVTALKARGGHGLPWTPYYGEASVDRRLRIARAMREASEEHWRNQTSECLASASDQNRQMIEDDEERVASMRADTDTVIDSILRHAKRVQDHAANTKASLKYYVSTFAQARPNVIFKKVEIATPCFPDAPAALNAALNRARERLTHCRHAAADLDGFLAQVREEAMLNLSQMFSQMHAN